MKEKILLVLLAFETFLLALTVHLIVEKVKSIEENQFKINEYILERIGG